MPWSSVRTRTASSPMPVSEGWVGSTASRTAGPGMSMRETDHDLPEICSKYDLSSAEASSMNSSEGARTTMVSSASQPDQVTAVDSDADAMNGTEASALTSPRSRGSSRYLDLLLNEDMVTEGVGITKVAEAHHRSRSYCSIGLANEEPFQV